MKDNNKLKGFENNITTPFNKQNLLTKTKALHETAQSILFELSERSETKSVQQHD